MRLRADGRLRRGVPGVRAGVGGRGPRVRPRAGGGAAGLPLRETGVRHRVLAVRDSRAAGPPRSSSASPSAWSPRAAPSTPRSASGASGGAARSAPSTCTSSAPCTRTPTSAWRSSQSSTRPTAPLFKIKDDPRVTRIGKFIRKHSMAPVIIGTPGDGEPTKSLSHPENSSLDLQKCERRPGTSLGARHHYTNFQFLSFAVFGGPEGASGRPLCACVQAPFAAVGTVA